MGEYPYPGGVMVIRTKSGFQARTKQVILRLDKVIYERGESPPLMKARRVLNRMLDTSLRSEDVKPFRDDFEKASDAIRAQCPKDNDTSNLLWDLLDFIDYRA